MWQVLTFERGKESLFFKLFSPCGFWRLPLLKWPGVPVLLKAPCRMLSHQTDCLEASKRSHWNACLAETHTDTERKKDREREVRQKKRNDRRTREARKDNESSSPLWHNVHVQICCSVCFLQHISILQYVVNLSVDSLLVDTWCNNWLMNASWKL